MDSITDILKEADREAHAARCNLTEGKIRDAYVSVAQAVHLYHEGTEYLFGNGFKRVDGAVGQCFDCEPLFLVTVLALQAGDDEEFIQTIRDCILDNTMRRDQIKMMMFPESDDANVVDEGPAETNCGTSS